MSPILGITASSNKPRGLPVAGASLWLDASDSTTYTFASASDVSEWRDKSANGYIFQQATSANQPKANGTLNGKTTLTFDGSNDRLVGTNTAGLHSTSWSLFVVLKSNSTATQRAMGKRNTSGPTNDDAGIGYFSSKLFMVSQFLSSGVNATITGAGANTFIIQSNGSNGLYDAYISSSYVIANNTNAAMRFAGANLASATAGNQALASNVGQIAIGCLYDNVSSFGEFFNGHIAEIIRYNSALGTTDRQAVESYLTTKWGV